MKLVNLHPTTERELHSRFYTKAFGSKETTKSLWNQTLTEMVQIRRLSPIHAMALNDFPPERHDRYNRNQVIESFKDVLMQSSEIEDVFFLFSIHCENMYDQGRISYNEAMDMELTTEEEETLRQFLPVPH